MMQSPWMVLKTSFSVLDGAGTITCSGLTDQPFSLDVSHFFIIWVHITIPERLLGATKHQLKGLHIVHRTDSPLEQNSVIQFLHSIQLGGNNAT
jgi:hypothetical protein